MNLFIFDPLSRSLLYSLLQRSTMLPYSPTTKTFVAAPQAGAADSLVAPTWSSDPNHKGIGVVNFPGLVSPTNFGDLLAVAHDPVTFAPVTQPVPVAPLNGTGGSPVQIGIVNLGGA